MNRAIANAAASLSRITQSRDDRRRGQSATPALDRGTCLRLLSFCEVGRLAYVARAGMPDIVPVNYRLDGESILFRTASGPKLQAAERRDHVAFEVDVTDPDDETAWSVVVHGRASVVPVTAVGVLPHAWAPGPHRHLVRICPTRITGRSLSGGHEDPREAGALQ